MTRQQTCKGVFLGTNAQVRAVAVAQLALAWLTAQGKDITPISSDKTRRHLEENITAIDIQLSKEDLERLEEIFPPGAAAGPRTKDLHRVNV